MIPKLVQWPVPALATFTLPSQADAVPGAENLPAWVTAFLVGVWVTVSVLEKLGKLPGGGSERRDSAFTDADRDLLRSAASGSIPDRTRQQLEDVYKIVTREDPDSAGKMLVWGERNTHEMLTQILNTLQRVDDQQGVLISLLRKNGHT